MAKKKTDQIDTIETTESIEATQNKILPYVFKVNLKMGNTTFYQGQIVDMSPCEAEEFKDYVYSYYPQAEDCGCNK